MPRVPMSVCSRYQSMSTSVKPSQYLAPKLGKKKESNSCSFNDLFHPKSKNLPTCSLAANLFLYTLRHASCNRAECCLCRLPFPLAEQEAWLRHSILNLRHPNSAVIKTQSHCLLSLSKGSFICGDDFSVVTRGKRKKRGRRREKKVNFF